MHFSLPILLFPILSLAIPTPLFPRQETNLNISINAATSHVTSKTGLQWYSASFEDGNSGRTDPSSYTCYSGPASNFPGMDKWMSFQSMWTLMARDALTPIGDTQSEQSQMLSAIKKISKQAKVDARVILAVIIGESTGNVRVGCTNNGVQNCGLMQSHNPKVTAFNPKHPLKSITQQIRDGTQGTASGAGLVQLFNNDALTSGNLWNVLRAYNSGSVDKQDLSDPMGATAAYVSNMANFLQGWHGYGPDGPETCGFR